MGNLSQDCQKVGGQIMDVNVTTVAYARGYTDALKHFIEGANRGLTAHEIIGAMKQALEDVKNGGEA